MAVGAYRKDEHSTVPRAVLRTIPFFFFCLGNDLFRVHELHNVALTFTLVKIGIRIEARNIGEIRLLLRNSAESDKIGRLFSSFSQSQSLDLQQLFTHVGQSDARRLRRELASVAC